jgi:hypothetical protein
VRYDALVADPLGTLERVYGHFGLPFTGAAADAMRVMVSQKGASSAHQYTLADFGLTAEDVNERFGPAIITR